MSVVRVTSPAALGATRMSTGRVVDAAGDRAAHVDPLRAFGGVGRDRDVERDLGRRRPPSRFDPVDGEAATAQDRGPARRERCRPRGRRDRAPAVVTVISKLGVEPGATAMAGNGVRQGDLARSGLTGRPQPASRVRRSMPRAPHLAKRDRTSDRTSETLDTTDTGHLLWVDTSRRLLGQPDPGHALPAGRSAGSVRPERWLNQPTLRLKRPQSSASRGDRTEGARLPRTIGRLTIRPFRR